MKARTSEGRATAMTAAGSVVALAAGLGGTAAWASPGRVDVVMRSADRDVRWGNEGCSATYSRMTMPLTDIANQEDGPVEVVSVRPSDATGGIRVLDYVVTDSTHLAVGDQTLPPARYASHTLPAGTAGWIAILAAGVDGSRTTGFDVALRSGRASQTVHVNGGLAFTKEPCSGRS